MLRSSLRRVLSSSLKEAERLFAQSLLLFLKEAERLFAQSLLPFSLGG